MAFIRPDRLETACLFPLAEFLSSLSDLGIRATLDDYRRIALALRAGGPWTRAQLRGVVAALLVRDRDQLAPFRQRFDAFFSLTAQEEAPIPPLDIQRALSELRQMAAEPRSKRIQLVWPLRAGESETYVSRDDETQGSRDHPWRWSALGLVLLAGLVVLGQWITSRRPPVQPSPDRPPAVAAQSNQPSQPPPQQTTPASMPRMRTYPQVPVLRLKSFWPWPQPPAWTDYRLLSIAALGWGLWVWRWARSKRRAAVPAELGPGPRLFRPGILGGSPAPRLNRQILDRVADSLGYFRSEQAGKDLDVRESVERTIRNGGIPTPVFALRRQSRSVFILEDLWAGARDWNPIAQELSQGLAERGVPTMHGFFLGVPDRFRTADGFDQRIEDLEDERRGYLVLIFSDAKGLGSPEAAFVLERLARWPQVAWMQLQERRAWDRTARRPALHGLSVFPADPQGLLEALSLFTTERAAKEAGLEPEAWRGLSALPVHGSLEAHLEAVLGDSLLWAQACAMVPPPISLGLADRLRERFHPELPASRIERLLALPGSALIAKSLQLDDRSLAVLREGFALYRSPREQKAVLRFLLTQIEKAEPDDPESAAHQAWEWRLERTRLELDPEPAAERLLALAQGPLREAIRRDLALHWKLRPARKRRLLRRRSMRANTAERLSALMENRELPVWQRYRPDLWPAAGFAATALALAAIALWRSSFPHENSVALLFRNGLYATGQVVKIEVSRQNPQGIKPSEYSVTSPAILSTGWPAGQLRLAMLLAGKGVTTARLNAFRPGTYELEVGTRSMMLACREEMPELGLVVSRCPEPSVASLLTTSAVGRSTIKRVFPTNKKWQTTVGLEFASGDSHSAVGDFLLAFGIVQVVYTVRDPSFRPEALKEPEAVAWIRNRWNPWSDQVGVLAWASLGRPHLATYPPLQMREVSLADWRPIDIGTSLPGTIESTIDLLKFLRGPLAPVPEDKQTAVNRQASGDLAKKPSAVQPGSQLPPNEPSARKKPEPAPPWFAYPNTPSGVEELKEGFPKAPANEPREAKEPPCPNPALTRCGDQCVDVKTNPFHYGGCFQIAPSLSRSAAESVDSPPSWRDESIQPRRYYRLFYTWNDKNSAVIILGLPSRSGWDRGTAPAFVDLQLASNELTPAEIATAGYLLAVTDVEVHCSGKAWVAGFASTAREMYEKLSTQSTWRSVPKQPWRGPGETSTNTGLVRTLGPALKTWEELCLQR